MSLKKCIEWCSKEFIEATCPYCGISDRYHGDFWEGEKITCKNKKCKKKFILGPEE